MKPYLPSGWRVLPDPEAVAAEAARLIAAAGSEALAARGVFRLVLAGGRTPEAAYRRLVRLEINWQRWEIFLGDERCLPAGHPDRNSRMVWDAWLSQLGPGPAGTEPTESEPTESDPAESDPAESEPAESEPAGFAPEVSGLEATYPEANFHVTVQTPSPQPSPARGEGVGESAVCAAEAPPGREGSERIPLHEVSRYPSPGARFYPIPAEVGAELAAARYARLVARAAPFDLVLLGMGEDGHTASLFPGLPLGAEDWTLAVHGAPKPPSERVSLGLRALRAARQRLVLVTGASKRAALDRWRAGADLPIARACQGLAPGVLLDREALPLEP